jgi:hypothetical protein
MLAPYPFHPAFYELYRYKTIQARYINQESSQEIKTHSVQLWGEMPGPHSSLFMAYMHQTQDHWVDSTLALPWERRSALEHKNFGVQAVRVVPIWSPLLRKSCTWSVSDDAMFQAYFGEVTMALISILFAARCCQLHELGILCWGTPPNLPATPRILDRTLCCHDHMHACLRRRAIVFSYLLLLRSTCHDPSFMSHDSPPFCEPTMTHPAIDLLCLALTGSHWQCVHDIGICWVLVPLVGCERAVPLVHKAWFGDEFFVRPLVIYRRVLKKFHLSPGTGYPLFACLPGLWPILLRKSIARVIHPSMYAQDFFLYQLIYPLLLSYSLCNLTHLYCWWKLTVCDLSNYMMWGIMRHKFQRQHLTSETKGLSRTSSCSTPPFFFLFKETISNLWVWGYGPVG